jgi:hypothetical protein
MSNSGNGFGAVTGGLRRLLVVVEENIADLPDVSVEKGVLEQALSTAEQAKNRQDAHSGDKQLATQEMKAALRRAQDAGIQLQNAAKFKLGPRNEKLSAFQVTPLRKRGPRKSAQLQKQAEELQQKENKLLKKQVELLKKEEEGPGQTTS